jgi:hypothetical protein
MSAVHKRRWTTSAGEARESWVVDYTDGKGVRRRKTFARKKDADAFAATATVEIREGVHVADSASVTVKAAGKLWITSAKASGLERSTTAQYDQHVRLHIEPLIGSMKLSAISIPAIRSFEDRLRQEGRSPAMVRKILVSLGTLIADAQERGLTARNPVRDMRVRRAGRRGS